MRDEAIFWNGVYETVLEDIYNIQKLLPEQILFLQPYARDRVVRLAENPPSVEDPVRLLLSLTTHLPNVRYVCEIVGWDDKLNVAGPKMDVLNKIIYSLQWPFESGVFQTMDDSGVKPRNLLHVRRMKKLSKPFSVERLVKSDSGEPLSPDRSTSGGWVYIATPSEDFLEEFL